MSTWIAILPFFISLIYVYYTSPEKAFYTIYFPFLILLPQLFTPSITVFHTQGFAQFAIMPIAMFFLFQKILSNKYNTPISITDFLVILYLGLCAYSEYENTQTRFVFSLLSDKSTSVLLPYLLAKHLIHPRGYSILLAKRIVFLVFIDVILSVYELRLSYNPYIIYLGKLFPQQWVGSWPTAFRYGLARIAGPFAQPILFGTMIGIAFLLNYWLIKCNFWEKRFSWLPRLFIKKGTILAIVLFAGMILTFSRGPLISSFLGILLMGIAFSKRRRQSAFYRLTFIFVLALIAINYYSYYEQVNRFFASSEMESTIAYRAELFEKYQKYVLQRPYWGWGFTTLPVTDALTSVDNQYLWLALKHGLIAVGAYVLIILWVIARLFFRGMRDSDPERLDISLSFTLLGICSLMAITFFTVFMGLQMEPIFFIMIGWSEGFLLSKTTKMDKQLGMMTT